MPELGSLVSIMWHFPAFVYAEYDTVCLEMLQFLQRFIVSFVGSYLSHLWATYPPGTGLSCCFVFVTLTV